MQADLVPLINQINTLRTKLATAGLPAGSIVETLDTVTSPPNLKPLNGGTLSRSWFPELDAISSLQDALVSVTLLDPPGYSGKLSWMGDYFTTDDRQVVRWNGTALTTTVVGPATEANCKVVGFRDLGAGARKVAVTQTPAAGEGIMESFQLWTTDAGGTTWSALSMTTSFPRGFYLGDQRYRMGVVYSEAGGSSWAVTYANGMFFILITPMLDEYSVAGQDEIWRWDPNNPSTPLVFVNKVPDVFDGFITPRGGWLAGNSVITHYNGLPGTGAKVTFYPSMTGPSGPTNFNTPRALHVTDSGSILGLVNGNDYAAQMPLWNMQATEAQPGPTNLFVRTLPASIIEDFSLMGTSFNHEHYLPIATTAWFMGGQRAVDGGARYIPMLLACVGFNSWHLIEHSSFATGYDDWAFYHGFQVLDSANPAQQCTLMHMSNGLTSKIAKVIMNPANEFGVTLPNVPASGGYRKWIAPGTSLQFANKAPGDRSGGGGGG